MPASISAKERARYDVGKGAIRLPLDKPVPLPLVKKIIAARRAEIDDQAAAKKKAPAKSVAAKTKPGLPKG